MDMTIPPAVISPAGMTSRMVVMMTPDDKRAIEARARTQGMTPSELIRRAARDYTPLDPAQESALAVLADELERVVAGIRHDLGSALDDLAAHRAEMAMLKASA